MIYFKSLCIVGNSNWAHKIESILAKSDLNLKVTIIGARQFLSYAANEFESKLPQPDLLWIATNPDLQIQILERLSSRHYNIVIEKPYAYDLVQLGELENTIRESSSLINFSQPWLYSKLWQTARELLRDITHPVTINITREGSLRNTRIPSYLNWLSHDIFLLNDLFTGLDLHNLKSLHRNAHNEYSLILELSDHFTVSLSNRKIAPRESRWEICWESNEVILDFDSHTLTSNLPGLESVSFPHDQPLLNMVRSFSNIQQDYGVLKFLRMQELLFLR
jgi:predicted dehydrogenase